MPETRLHIEPERIDALPLALGMLQRMGVPQIVDAHLGSGHGNRQGLSYGQLTHGFSAHIITAQDHRLVTVEAWAQGHPWVDAHPEHRPAGVHADRVRGPAGIAGAARHLGWPV